MRRAGGDVSGALPKDDVAAVPVQNCAEAKPAPTKDLDIGEVGLPERVNRGCLIFELIGRLEHDKCRASDQIMGFRHAIYRGFRDKIPLLVREYLRQLAG